MRSLRVWNDIDKINLTTAWRLVQVSNATALDIQCYIVIVSLFSHIVVYVNYKYL